MTEKRCFMSCVSSVLRPLGPHVRTAVVALAAVLVSPAAVMAQSQAPAPGAAQAAVPPVDVAGVWIDHSGKGAVEIAPCGQTLCGRIFWIKDPVDKATGKPLTDALNPDQAKRSSPICGLQIIGELKRQQSGAWDGGWIYNPEDGGRFKVEVRLRNRDLLQVTGYLGVKFLGETFVWKRAPSNIARCDVQAKRAL
jgi:uncharacterized protein (DUF2147 family)